MSYRELSAWGSLVITLIIFGNYFLNGVLSGQATAGLLLGTVIALVVLEIIYNILIATWKRDLPADERDVLIDLKASRNASWVSSVGIVLLITQVLFYRMVNGSSWIESTMDWVNALLFILIASESVRFASQAISYRKGV